MTTTHDGLGRLLKFLNLLDDKGLEYRLEHQAPDSITVIFALVGMRIEADFDAEMMQFSIFRGDESVDTDAKRLLDLIEENH